MEIVLKDRHFMNKSELKIQLTDRGYQFGDGIYEVVGVYEGRPFKLTEHITRLIRSAREIKLALPYTENELHTMLLQLKEKNNLQNGYIYMQITRGVAPRSHEFPKSNPEPVLTAYTVEEERLDGKCYEEGIDVTLTRDIRWLRCDIKTLNLLPNVLAKQEAVEQGAYEAVFVRDNGIVTESCASNLFVVKDGVVLTHPANELILNGITRQTVLEICKELAIPTVEIPFSKEFLLEADEAFLSSTYSDVTPIKNIIGEDIQFKTPGVITEQIIKKLDAYTFGHVATK